MPAMWHIQHPGAQFHENTNPAVRIMADCAVLCTLRASIWLGVRVGSRTCRGCGDFTAVIILSGRNRDMTIRRGRCYVPIEIGQPRVTTATAGGDFFQVISCSADDSTLVVVGDVEGKACMRNCLRR